MKTDYYEILQVHPKASPIVIKKAYRALLLELGNHPDQGGDAESTRLLNEAYHVLGDPKRRLEYDNRPRPEAKLAMVFMVMCPTCGVFNRIRSEERLSLARCGRCGKRLNTPPQKPHRLVIGLAIAAVLLSLVAWILVPQREVEVVSRGAPKEVGSPIRMGQIYEEQKQLDKALSEYQAACRRDPEAGYPRYLMGRTLLELHRFEEAKQSLTRAIALSPQDALSRTTLGHVYMEQDNPKAAIPHYEKALELSPSAEAATMLGMALLADNQEARAKATFQKAVSMDNHYRPALIRLGEIYREEGKPKEALALLERAAGMCGEDPELHYLIAEVARQLRDSKRAVSELETCLAQSKNPILSARARQALQELH